MRKLVLFVILVSMTIGGYAYQISGITLPVPTGLFPKESELSVFHRFKGTMFDEDAQTFIGSGQGANIGISYRYQILDGLELSGGYISHEEGYQLATSYKLPFENLPVLIQPQIAFLSHDNPTNELGRTNNLLYSIAVQNPPVWDRVALMAVIGYDGYYDHLVNGIGLSVGVLESMKVIAEYYPVWDRNTASSATHHYLQAKDAWAAGIRFETYGHHFIFSVGNNDNGDLRQMSMGSKNNDLHFGFNLQRRFQF